MSTAKPTDTRSLFTAQSDAYRAGRPTYDPAFFAWLAQAAPGTQLAWDCGCGSGQASVDLARHFQRVIATDINASQLEHAPREANIDYRCEPAESTSLEAGSVDLTLVARRCTGSMSSVSMPKSVAFRVLVRCWRWCRTTC